MEYFLLIGIGILFIVINLFQLREHANYGQGFTVGVFLLLVALIFWTARYL